MDRKVRKNMEKNFMNNKKTSTLMNRFYAIVLVMLLVTVSISGVIGWNIRDPSGTTAGYWRGNAGYIVTGDDVVYRPTGDNLQSAIYSLNNSDNKTIMVPSMNINRNI